MGNYTHKEIEIALEKDWCYHNDSAVAKANAETGRAFIRQLLEEYEALDVKRAYFENLARQQGRRIEQLEAELKADPLHRVPPFDWGPEGEPEGTPIRYSVNGVKLEWDPEDELTG